jgi:hypothetical protein
MSAVPSQQRDPAAYKEILKRSYVSLSNLMINDGVTQPVFSLLTLREDYAVDRSERPVSQRGGRSCKAQ